MCWSEKDGDDCEVCKAIFATCTHTDTFKNADDENECCFCGKVVPKDICAHCGVEFRTIKECSQGCMSR